jgi:hypothetical protein
VITQELIDYVAHANDDIARVLRAALQPAVDIFIRAMWPPAPDHRHIMRKKIRRRYR